MLRSAIQYKVLEAGGVFVEVPTKQVKPTQTCSNCGHQRKKDLGERTHNCEKCGVVLDRDINAALVMLLWALGKLPGAGTVLADAECDSFWRNPEMGGIPGFSRVTHNGESSHFNPLLMTT